MSNSTLSLDTRVRDYLLAHTLRDSESKASLRQETAALTMGRMQICPEQGQLMTLITELIGAEKAIEVGTFTGYSALCVAKGLPENGRLVACDVSKEWTDIGWPHWRAAGVAHKIDLRLGPAIETLQELIDTKEVFDLAFIDADKLNYGMYYEQVLSLLRPGGVIMVDNVLWGGTVADPDVQDPDTNAIRVLNAKIIADERVTMAMLPIGDGLTIARKR